jgi:hypothetical protein
MNLTNSSLQNKVQRIAGQSLNVHHGNRIDLRYPIYSRKLKKE